MPKFTADRYNVEGKRLELEVPTASGRWERTGLRGNRIDLIDGVMTDFEWLLAPRE